MLCAAVASPPPTTIPSWAIRIISPWVSRLEGKRKISAIPKARTTPWLNRVIGPRNNSSFHAPTEAKGVVLISVPARTRVTTRLCRIVAATWGCLFLGTVYKTNKVNKVSIAMAWTEKDWFEQPIITAKRYCLTTGLLLRKEGKKELNSLWEDISLLCYAYTISLSKGGFEPQQYCCKELQAQLAIALISTRIERVLFPRKRNVRAATLRNLTNDWNRTSNYWVETSYPTVRPH